MIDYESSFSHTQRDTLFQSEKEVRCRYHQFYTQHHRGEVLYQHTQIEKRQMPIKLRIKQTEFLLVCTTDDNLHNSKGCGIFRNGKLT